MGDGLTHLIRPVFGGGQDHAARTRTEVFEFYDVRSLLFQDVLPDDPKISRPVLDEDRNVRGPTDNELHALGPIHQPPPIVPQYLHRQPGSPERPHGVLEDRAFRNCDPEPPHESTFLATSAALKISNSSPERASFRPSEAG